MRKTVTYLLGVAGVLLVLAVSCRHVSPEEVTAEIVVTPEMDTPTRGFINGSADLNTTGSRVRVYDVISGFEGTINGTPVTASETATYFSDVLTYNGSRWEFPDLSYRWTGSGVHHFFGWLLKDAKSNLDVSASVLNPSYNESTHVLSVPATGKVNINANDFDQIDFLYSRNEVVRDVSSKDFSKVDLNMAHLFSAFSLMVENRSSDEVTIHSVTMPSLPVSGSVTADYTPDGRTEPVMNYSVDTKTPSWTQAGGFSAQAPYFFTNQCGSGVTLEPSSGTYRRLNAFTGQRLSVTAAPDYRMIWPILDKDILSPDSSPAAHTDSLIRISYSYTVSGQTFVRNDVGVKLPDLAWTPGKRTSLIVTLNDKVIDLNFVVQDWEFHDLPLDFTTGTATVTTAFTFVENTYGRVEGKKYYTNGAEPVKARFRITNPVGATLFVEPIGDTSYFTISLDHDTVDPTVDNGVITVTVAPNTSKTPTEDKWLKMRFYVSNGVQEVNIDSEVRGDDYTIVWGN